MKSQCGTNGCDQAGTLRHILNRDFYCAACAQAINEESAAHGGPQCFTLSDLTRDADHVKKIGEI